MKLSAQTRFNILGVMLWAVSFAMRWLPKGLYSLVLLFLAVVALYMYTDIANFDNKVIQPFAKWIVGIAMFYYLICAIGCLHLIW